MKAHKGHSYRPLFALAAVVMAMVGGVTLFLGQSEAAAPPRYVIEVSDTDFNPSVCSVNRNDQVMWKNVGTVVHRVIRPDAGVGAPPLYDSGDLQPGESSSPLQLTGGLRWTMHDQYHPELTGVVQTPLTANNGQVSCSKEAPTPTPSPTPTATETPVPTPTPIPHSLGYCRAESLGAVAGSEGCAIAGQLAADSAGE